MEIQDFPYSRSGRGALLASALIGAVGTCLSCAPAPPIRASDLAVERARVAAVRGGDRDTVGGVEHVVLPGQTLWRIAKAYGIAPLELARANGIEDPTRIDVGQRLFVPGAVVVRAVPPYPAPLERSDPGPVRAAPNPAGETAGTDWSWPVRGELISGYGAPRRGHRHSGVDIRGRHGDPVRAARAGRVTYSSSGMSGYGKTIILDHGGGLSTLYAHNTSLLVTPGQWVEQGAEIARIGRTGNATTEHCHFEIRRDGRAIDPLPFLAETLEARR